ncbi:MAG: helix-turn-helix transcriptional regulator [Spirochaetia bacterium]|nr:helix-turn-helix transcriptional regulator [Spirochaetia bacterium]
MALFPGLTYLFWGHDKHYHWHIDKTFTYFGLNYAHRGKVVFSMGAEPPVVWEGPVAWIVWPGPRFRYGDPAHQLEWDHRFVSFHGKRVGEWSRSGLFPRRSGRSLFPIRSPERFRLAFDELLELLNQGEDKRDEATHVLEGLLLSLQPPSRKFQTAPGIQKCFEKIRQHPEKEWDFEALAAEAGFSYSHFRRLFRNLRGASPQKVLVSLRMELASAMMREKNLSLREVADRSGITDLNYFNKLFKKHFYVTPGAFRRELHRD